MDDLYTTLTKKASTYRYLYHYTSIDALEAILRNGSLRLSRLDLVNDPKENQRITSLWNSKVFVACFTNTLENELYFFKNYGKVRIILSNNFTSPSVFFDSELTKKIPFFKSHYNLSTNTSLNSYEQSDDWCIYDTSLADIYYTDNLCSHISNDGKESNAGLIKVKQGFDKHNTMQNWTIEKESRLRVTVRPIGSEFVSNKTVFYYPKPFFNYLFIPIRDIIKKIEIFTECSDVEHRQFNAIVGEYLF